MISFLLYIFFCFCLQYRYMMVRLGKSVRQSKRRWKLSSHRQDGVPFHQSNSEQSYSQKEENQTFLCCNVALNYYSQILWNSKSDYNNFSFLFCYLSRRKESYFVHWLVSKQKTRSLYANSHCKQYVLEPIRWRRRHQTVFSLPLQIPPLNCFACQTTTASTLPICQQCPVLTILTVRY